MKQQPVAFFDVDGTIFRSSLLIELVEKLVENKVFPYEAKETYLQSRESWQNRQGTYDDYIKNVISSYLGHIKGVFYGDLADAGLELVEEQRNRVYRYTRDLIRELKTEGYYVVAISQSPKTILDKFCQEYGFDKVYGRMYEIGPTDKFIGTVIEEELIANKANIAKRVFAKDFITSKNSVAVGDTEGDIALLELVEKPICFNPNKLLYTKAKIEGWPVVVERKDVIYHI